MDNIFNKLVDRLNSALLKPAHPPDAATAAAAAATTATDFVETGTELRDDSAHSSSNTGPLPHPPRVLVLRSCTSRGRKILFDSYHVTDDGEYTRQSDAKFLKETVAEFAFGSVSIATNHTNRFTKFNHNNQTHLIWANVFSTRQQSNCVHEPPPPRPLLSTSCSSSSGYYSSLPLMTSSSPGHNNQKGTTLSLPSDNHNQHQRTYYLSCVIILTTPTTNLPPTTTLLSAPLDSALSTLKTLTLKTYTRLKTFPVTLKSFANSLHLDLTNLLSHTHLKSISAPLAMTTTITSHPATPDLISLLIANPNAHVVIATRKIDNYNKFEAFFTIAHTIHQFLSNKQRRRCCHHGNNDDSGVHLNNGSSCQSSFSSRQGGNNEPLSNSLSSLSSSSEEEEEEIPQEPTTSKGFYLGEEEDDPEEHQEFALGDVDLNKLYQNKPQKPTTTPPTLPPTIISVPLTLPPIPCFPKPPHPLEDQQSYYINTSRRYVPFHRYQVILSPVPPTYDASHLLLLQTTPILEVNPEDSPQSEHSTLQLTPPPTLRSSPK